MSARGTEGRPHVEAPVAATTGPTDGDVADVANVADTTPMGRGERWALHQVRHYGVARFLTLMTVVAIAASFVLVVIALLVLDGFSSPEYWVPSLVVGGLVTAVLVPPLLLFSARLVARLDTTTQLLRESAITDPLTGVANRRGFFAALDEAAEAGDVEVAMIDLDRFKLLNDRHGHPAGDAALRLVAAWLTEFVGAAGTVGRLGGDEFAFVAVPDPNRPAPDRHEFALGDITFTVSVGVASTCGRDPHDALLDADAALYRRKRERHADGILRHTDRPAPTDC